MSERDDFVAEMAELMAISDDFSIKMDALSDIGLTFDSMCDIYGGLLGKSLGYLSKMYDINKEALEWFIYENAWGRNGWTCSKGKGKKKKKEYEIKTAADLWDFEKR